MSLPSETFDTNRNAADLFHQIQENHEVLPLIESFVKVSLELEKLPPLAVTYAQTREYELVTLQYEIAKQVLINALDRFYGYGSYGEIIEQLAEWYHIKLGSQQQRNQATKGLFNGPDYIY